MQLNLYIFNQLFRTCMGLITVLISIIWLFQSIRLLEFVVDKGASVGEFFAMSVASMPLWVDDHRANIGIYCGELGV